MVSQSSNYSNSVNRREHSSQTHSTYILEVGYELVYKRTYDEQLNILKHYQPPQKFQNTWKRIALNIGNRLTRYSINIGLFGRRMIQIVPLLELYSDFGGSGSVAAMIAYGLGRGMIDTIIATGIYSIVIPILPANKYSEGLLFIPGNETKFLPQEKNSLQDIKSNIVINIKPNEFDPVIQDIAKTYGGEILSRDSKKTDHDSKIQTILFKFDTKESNFETQIKRFLYSLPINVSLLSIYKLNIDGKNLVGNSEIDDKALLFPRKNTTRKSLISDSDLSRVDKKIIEYGETQLAIYNKVNKNIKYLVEYIRPLRFFQRLLPRSYRVPEFSPMK